MSSLLQTFGWLDLLAFSFPLATLVAGLMVLTAAVLAGKASSWGLMFWSLTAACLAAFGFSLAFHYFRARFVGAPASWHLVLNSADISGAIFLVAFIPSALVLPFFHAALLYWGRISEYTPRPRHGTGRRLTEKITLVVLLGIAASVGILAARSALLPAVLFGDPEALKCSTAGPVPAALKPDCSLRFSVLLDRLATALGLRRTTGFDVGLAILLIAAILQAIDSFIAIWDRLWGGQTRPPEEPDEEGEKLPPVIPAEEFPPIPKSLPLQDPYYQQSVRKIEEALELFDEDSSEISENSLEQHPEGEQ